jgi:hypothetical protein
VDAGRIRSITNWSKKWIDQYHFSNKTNMASRYNTRTSVEVWLADRLETCVHHSDLQASYMWVKRYIDQHGGNWDGLKPFPEFADDLDANVQYYGIRSGGTCVSTSDCQIVVFYGELIL